MVEETRAWHRMALATGIVAAIFCAVIVVGLVASYQEDQRTNPLVAKNIQVMKTALLDRPNDDGLKQQIRSQDLELRREFFRRRAFMFQGGYLLLGGVVALLIALKSAAQLSKKPPTFAAGVEDVWRANVIARWGVVGAGVVLVGVMGVWAVVPGGTYVELEPSPAAGGSVAMAAAGHPTAQMLAENWPSFRGAQGSGIVEEAKWPVNWDGQSGAGIVWKTAVPLPGNNSPIVWGEKVFVSGSDGKKREVYCFDAKTGGIVWRQNVVTMVKGEMPEIFEDTGHAASTMVTDGRRVVAIFPTGDIAAFDLNGKKVWARNLGVPESMYSYASSLAMCEDRVIVQYDQGSNAEGGKSVLMSLDGGTGETVWQTKRPVVNSWSSPIVVNGAAGWQVITCANPWVIAYDAKKGEEMWRANCLDGDVAPSPVSVGGWVYVANDRAKVAAIRMGGKGDVTKTNIAWTAEDGLPDIVSPLCDGRQVFVVTSAGIITCYDTQKGAKVWEHDMQTPAHASPVLVGKTIYLLDLKGVMHRFEGGAAFKELGTASLGEEVWASPAFAGGKIYIRGKSNLYCIGSK